MIQGGDMKLTCFSSSVNGGLLVTSTPSPLGRTCGKGGGEQVRSPRAGNELEGE